MQQALIAAGIDIPGGADGIYGDDTMIAVAEYQRRNPELRETGAVDVATATALGVHVDSDAAPDTAVGDEPADDRRSPTDDRRLTAPMTASAGAPADSPSGWVLAAAGTAAVVVLAASMVAARRRHVVARRAGGGGPGCTRRRHRAAASRTYADPASAQPCPARQGVYDHEREELPALADSGELPVSS